MVTTCPTGTRYTFRLSCQPVSKRRPEPIDPTANGCCQLSQLVPDPNEKTPPEHIDNDDGGMEMDPDDREN